MKRYANPKLMIMAMPGFGFLRITRALTGAAVMMFALMGSAQAADFVVTHPFNQVTGFCKSGVDCSLRQAVAAAVVSPGDDTISFAPSLDGQFIQSPGFPMRITSSDAITINGLGADRLMITGFGNTQIFVMEAGTVTINDLRMDAGLADSPPDGGAITVFNAGTTLNLNRCRIHNNQGYRGGGLAAYFGSVVNIRDSLIDGNESTTFGGGIYISSGATVNIVNSTISDNFTDVSSIGGGIFVDGNAGIVNISSSTITNNQGANLGGGIFHVFPGNAVNVRNSIIAGNFRPLRSGFKTPDVQGAFVSQGFNLIGSNSDVPPSGFTDGVNNDQVGPNDVSIDAKLLPLADYGGPTPTYALQPTSPAVDAGNDSVLTTDQRGFLRLFDQPSNPNAPGSNGADIGAFELQNFPPVAANNSYTSQEDTPLNVAAPGVLGNDTDIENDALTAQLVSAPAHAASFSLQTDGSFSYMPAADFNGTDSFTYKANDGNWDSKKATVTITITAVNDPAAAVNDSKVTNKDTALVFAASDLTANDSKGPSNESNQLLSVNGVISIAATHGQVSLSNGQITYQPAAGYTGAASFNYEVCDNGTTNGSADPKCATGTVNVTINPTFVLTVTKTADTNDGVCDSDCSLREALDVADSDSGVDTINFNIPANSPNCAGTNCTINLTSRLSPAADGGLLTTIDGSSGANRITLSGGGTVQILFVGNGVKIAVDNLNFTGAKLNTSSEGSAITLGEGGLTLVNSAVYGNGVGTAIYNDRGTLNLTNVTISGNATDAINNINGATTTATNCTITHNSGTSGSVFNAFSTFTIRNTIIAGNNPSASDVSGRFTSGGYNLIGNADRTFDFTATGDQRGSSAAPLDPRLAPLGFYGGKTMTHALLSGSPAINAGNTVDAPAADQRGAARVGAVDIGAYELNNSTNGGSFVAVLPDGTARTPYNYTLVQNRGAFTYSVTGGALAGGISLSTNGAIVSIAGTTNQSGLFNFTVTATDGVNSIVTDYSVQFLPAPTMTVATGLSRQQGSGVSNSQIATAANSNVVVSVTSVNPTNGVSISNIVNTDGNITADIAASCAASTGTFTLQAIDGATTVNDTLTITVTPNTPPVLTYGNQIAALNGSLTINPATGPSDNISVSALAVQSTGTFTGTLVLNTMTGAVSISNAAPAGTHTIVIRASDNCGLFTDASFTLNISKGNQAITFGALSDRTYGDAPFTVSATGGASGNAVTFSSLTPTLCTVSTNTVTILSVGNCFVRASQSGNSNYNAAPDIDRVFDINKATPVIAWNNPADITYGTALSGTQLNATASVAGSFGYTPPSSTVLPGGANQTLSVNFTPSDSTNYSSASRNVSINVLQANQTIGFNGLADKTYGNAPFTVGAAAGASGNPVNFSSQTPTVCTVGGATVTIVSAGACTVRASQSGNNNYNAAPNVDRSFTVNKAVAAVTLSSLSHTYDGTAKSATATTNPAGKTVAITYSHGGSGVTSPTNAGSYDVSAVINDQNYQGSTTGTLVIGKANQRMTFGTLSDRTFGNADFQVTVTSDAGLTVSLAATGNCTVTGNTVHLSGAGSCAITASQAGDGNYNAATAVGQSFSIGKANQTISFGALGNKTFGDADFTLSATSSSSLSVTFAATGNCTVLSSTVHLSGAGSCTITASQSGNSNYNAASSVERSFTVGKANQTITLAALGNKTFGNADFPVTATSNSGLAVSLTAAGKCTVTSTSPGTVHLTGAGSCTVTASQAGNTLYNAASSVERSFTVGKASQTITFAALGNKTFGDADFAVSSTASSGLPVSLAANGNCTVTPVSPGTVHLTGAGQCSIIASQGGNANYNAGTDVSRNFTINAMAVVIRFSSANYSVAEGAGSKTITVERTGDTSQAATVDYASSDHSNPADFMPCSSPGAGLASSRCDFSTAVGTLRFAAGETSKTFNVLVSQDNDLERTETLSLALSNPTGGAVFGVPATAILEITDDVTEAATNPVDVSSEFVRSLYHDMLNREPDGPGLAFWTDNIEKCHDPARRPAGLTVEQCVDKQRESTAVAFFSSPEFAMTGGFVYRLYKGSLTGSPNFDGGSPGSSPGRFPTFLEFMRDVSQVSEGIVVNNQISGAIVEANRNRLAAEFVQRPEFMAKYGGLNDALYVEELFRTTGISQEQFNSGAGSSVAGSSMADVKQTLLDGLTNGTETRASVLRKVVDGTVVISEGNVQFTTSYGQAFYNQELQRVFVYMEYVGYLRRNPDAAGFNHWLGKLNQYHGDPFQAEMVRSFILAPEYRNRFGQ